MFSGLNKPSTEASSSSSSFASPGSSNQNGFKSNPSEASKTTKASGSSYEDNLKALNESVVAWIQKHISANPYVDLTPIFNDYKQHMKNIDLKFSSSKTAAESSSLTTTVAFSTSKQPAVNSASIFSPLSQAPQETEESKSKPLNTGEHNFLEIY